MILSELLPIVAATYHSFFNGRITSIEIAWTLIGLFGIWLNWNNLKNAKEDVKAIILLKTNGDKLAIIESHARTAIVKIAANVVIFAIGIIAMSQPPTTNKNPVTITGIALTVGLFLIAMCININAYMDRNFRKAMIERARLNNQ